MEGSYWRETFSAGTRPSHPKIPCCCILYPAISPSRNKEAEKMVGLPFDCLSNPLGAVRVTFEKAIASGLEPSNFDGKDWGAIDVFRECLFDQGALLQVPLLDPTNIGLIKPNSLVRYRGMVQDMLGNEMYLGAFKDGATWRTNKFTDVASFLMGNSSETRLWDRHLFYCVPVPGQNSWTMQPSSESLINRCNNWSSKHGEKRRRENEMDTDHTTSNDEFQGSPSGSKKLREIGCSSQSLQGQDSMIGETSSKPNVLPDFDSKCLPCLVKVYDSQERDVKLNDIFEFIGVFTFDPELMIQRDGSDELNNELFEDPLVHLLPNKVPRLHCLIQRKLAVHDFLVSSPVTEQIPSLVRGIRESLLRHLTAVLGNDGVAAQCMLLHLLSRVHARVDSLALGTLSLNLTGFTGESISIFRNLLNGVIQGLVLFTQSVPLTVEYLNAASLAPRKDYDANRLVTGVLQLAEGTHLTIDETQLKAGTLNSTGVENARLLKTLMEVHKVEYDFKYHKMEMPTDVQLLVLSEGKSNILPADLVLPFQPAVASSSLDASVEALQAWRWYLATRRSLPHDVDLEMQKVMENDLVAARQEDRSLGSQDFNRWLTMARLMSASYGETKLTLEHWQMVKELERLRKERLQGATK